MAVSSGAVVTGRAAASSSRLVGKRGNMPGEYGFIANSILHSERERVNVAKRVRNSLNSGFYRTRPARAAYS